MKESQLRELLLTLSSNLNILRERKAKFGDNVPLDLFHLIEDHETAIGLVKARLEGQISAEALEKQLAPLNLSLDRGGTEIVTGIKIGALVIPTIPLVALLVVVVSALGFLGVNFLGPTKMEGRFNVAVAEFGELTPRGMSSSEIGELLGKWVFQDLEAENEQYPASQQVEIWHDSLPITQKRTTIGLITGDSPEERAEAAGEVAEKIEADVVIYGHLATAETPAVFVLEFYVSPRLRGETHTTIGRYQLGEPVQVPARFDPDDPLSREAVAGPLATRTNALFWLILGLKEELLGRSGQALEVFEQAEAQLSNWSDRGEGKETLYFFIGRSALFLNQDEKAEAAFERALDINPDFARAQIALGSVFYRRAQCRLHSIIFQDAEQACSLCRTQSGECIAQCETGQKDICLNQVKQDLTETVAHYKTGLVLAEQNQEPQIDTIAHLALATAYRLQGEVEIYLENHEAASGFLTLTIQETEQILEPLLAKEQYRFLGQAYQTLGAAYAQRARTLFDQKGNRTEIIADYEKARAAFQACAAQEEKIPYFDEILINQIVAGCISQDSITEKAMLDLEKGSP